MGLSEVLPCGAGFGPSRFGNGVGAFDVIFRQSVAVEFAVAFGPEGA